MSIVVYSKDSTSLLKDLYIKSNRDHFSKKVKIIKVFLKHLDNNYYSIPFAYAKKKGFRVDDSNFKRINVNFKGKLKEKQIEPYNLLSKTLDSDGCYKLELHTAFGKTVLGTKIACEKGLRTIVLTHRILITNGWIDTIRKFTDGKVGIKPKSMKKLDKDADIYVMSVTAISKLPKDFIKTIGMVIVDETKEFCTQKRINNILHLKPKYIIGLCADNKRKDGLDRVLPYIFGSKKVTRVNKKPFFVKKIYTQFKPNIIKNNSYYRRAEVDWNEVINSIANNEERNNYIADLAKSNSNKKILILCKRVSQCKYLYKRLKEIGESVDILTGTKHDYTDDRILISTYSKAGVGFDQKSSKNFKGVRFNTLILATDTLEILQSLGRVFRTHHIPLIFDIVDDFSSFKRHSNKRNKLFIDLGGTIEEEWLDL